MAVYALVERYTGKRLAAYGAVDGNRFEVGSLLRVKRRTYRVEALIVASRSDNASDFEVVVERVQ